MEKDMEICKFLNELIERMEISTLRFQGMRDKTVMMISPTYKVFDNIIWYDENEFENGSTNKSGLFKFARNVILLKDNTGITEKELGFFELVGQCDSFDELKFKSQLYRI
jgi:hypothetical protein